MNNIKTKSLLVIAFAFLLLIMLLLIIISIYGMHSIHGRLDNIAQENIKKVQLTSEMLHSARERSILLHRMVMLDDPFERDDLSFLVNKNGALFAESRIKLNELRLNPEEQEILSKQGELTGEAIPLQRSIMKSLVNDDLEEAKNILIEEAMPAQDRVLDELKKLIVLQNEYAKDAVRIANDTYLNSRLLMLILGSIAVFVGVIISRIFIDKVTSTEKKLHDEKEKAQITFRSIGDAVITTNSVGKIEYLNDKAENYIGVLLTDVVGRHVSEVFVAQDIEYDLPVSEIINEYLNGNFEKIASNNIDLISKENRNIKIKLSLSPILSDRNILQGLIITFHDVTKSFELLRKIEYQATRDALTGLLNRREFEHKVKQTLSIYESDTYHAFFILDLDKFKIVNDSCGHQAGDELLKQLSIRLKNIIRRGDLIARLGGDEFSIFMSNIDEKNAIKHAEELLKSVSTYRFLWEDKTFSLGASIGIVVSSSESSSYDYLYHSADTACYIAKNEGRNRFHILSTKDQDMQKDNVDKNWITRLNKAIEEDEFYLYGQEIIPISPRAQGRKHVEMLIRMVSDDRKLISPMAFIPTAERYGLMHKIDQIVLIKTCNYLNDNPLEYGVYAVNLSGETLSSINAMEYLMQIVKESEILPGRLCLEITETVAIANLDNARSFMRSMQELGCYIALDDFGSGLSSFSYLKNLPLDYIKIDGVFVKEMINDKASAIMVDAIHSVGKKLGLITVAEYVEDEATVKLLKEIGVDLAQGYFYSEPELYIPPSYSGLEIGKPS